MSSYIQSMPLLLWLKWVIRTRRLRKQNPTLKIGAYSEAVNSRFGQYNIVYPYAKLIEVEMGDYSYVGGDTHLQYCKIGKFCSIAEGVKIGLGIHPTHLESTHPAFYSPQSQWCNVIKPDLSQDIVEYKHVTIGDDVWIGTNAMIMDGITIASHAIVAAGAVVTKDVPEYAIVAGVPAKVIKYREVIR